jgi:hypothetical protein
MEKLVQETGGCGRFQWLMVAAVKSGVAPIAWSMMQMAFAGLVPDWWCVPSNNGNFSHLHGNGSRDDLLNSLTRNDLGNVSFLDEGFCGHFVRKDNSTFQTCSFQGEQCGRIVFDDSVSTVVSEVSAFELL